MSDVLILRLMNAAQGNTGQANTAVTAQWLLVDTTGGRLGVVIAGAISDATALAAGKKVIVLAPGTDVHLANPALPVKRGAQLEQVMRYALEENLASDIDDLHFSMGKRQSDGNTPVAVVEHQHMTTWLETLAASGIAADALYSEADVLPAAASGITASITIIVDRNLIYVRRGNAPGATLDVQPLSEALQLALHSAGNSEDDSGEAGTDVLVYLHQAEYEIHAATLDVLRVRFPSLQTKLLPEGPLPLFALQATKTQAVSGINLLSGKYARKKSWNAALAPWRIAAMLTAVALLLHLSASGLQMWQLSRAEKQIDQQIRDVVTQTLPGTQVGDTRKARQQFETQLNASRGGSEAGLLLGLNILTATLEQMPDARIDALSYRPKVMDLRVTAPTVDALARIQQLVNEQGLHAEIQSATPRDNKVEGRLQVKSPGA